MCFENLFEDTSVAELELKTTDQYSFRFEINTCVFKAEQAQQFLNSKKLPFDASNSYAELVTHVMKNLSHRAFFSFYDDDIDEFVDTLPEGIKFLGSHTYEDSVLNFIDFLVTNNETIDKIIIHECPNCQKRFETNDEAINCCKRVHSRIGYRCKYCRTIFEFDEKSYAVECCSDITEEYRNS